ncbi:unnamed protein product [Acanthosepion pharaonis]|uniref:Uncharacterized protein n=1 Tax=Acanthosepion pharaonis TaxID=158019 RepID=A0A812E4F2_ACAPH|nr:unnamed protein product [Sepia pharaonis]
MLNTPTHRPTDFVQTSSSPRDKCDLTVDRCLSLFFAAPLSLAALSYPSLPSRYPSLPYPIPRCLILSLSALSISLCLLAIPRCLILSLVAFSLSLAALSYLSLPYPISLCLILSLSAFLLSRAALSYLSLPSRYPSLLYPISRCLLAISRCLSLYLAAFIRKF